MGDIVSELREMADHLWDVEHRINVDDDAKTLTAAADEIERLRKELKYWERVGRDKLDVELMHGLAAEGTPAPTGKTP